VNQGKLFDLMTSSDYWLPFIVIAVGSFFIVSGLIWLLTAVFPDDWEEPIAVTCSGLIFGIAFGFLVSPLVGAVTRDSAWRVDLAAALGVTDKIMTNASGEKLPTKAKQPRAPDERPKSSGASSETTAAHAPPASLPATNTIDSVQRDKALVGIAQAVKISDHAGAMKLIDGLERSGLGVPAAVKYFKAESLFGLKRFTEADFAVRDYLDAGQSARYYEEALKLSLAIDRGLDDLKQQWRSELDLLLSALNTPKGLHGGWTQHDPDSVSLGEKRTVWYCKIYSDFAFAPTASVQDGMLDISVSRTNNDGSSQCKVTEGNRDKRAQPGSMEFDDAVMRADYQRLRIPFSQLANVSFYERAPRCDGGSTPRFRMRFCPSSSSILGKYVEMSLDGVGTIYLMDTTLQGRFERLGSLFRQLGGVVN
jgi:hypothetical protein